jgi:hypothetical protein
VILPARPSYTVLPSFDFKMSGDTEYFGENPPKGAVITYYLKKRHIFGRFKLEIINPKGEVIKTLPTGKRRGINRVYWNTSLRVPKLASTSTLGGMVFGGPTVEPGIYTVRLTKNKKEYTSTIELRPDKLTTHSHEDRQLRHKAVMKTYNMLEHMAYIADTLKGITANLETTLKKEDKKISGKTKKFIKKQLEILADVRSEIIDPDASLFSSEKLQGKTISLYSSMLGYAGRPSQSQLTYVKTLDTSLVKVEKRFNDFINKNLPQINKRLGVLKIAGIKIISEEEYRKELEK